MKQKDKKCQPREIQETLRISEKEGHMQQRKKTDQNSRLIEQDRTGGITLDIPHIKSRIDMNSQDYQSNPYEKNYDLLAIGAKNYRIQKIQPS